MIISTSIEPVLGPGLQVQDFCTQILTSSPDHVFLTSLWETFSLTVLDLATVVTKIDKFMHSHGVPTTWVVTKWAEPELNWQQLKCPVIFFDFFLWRTYNELVNKKKSNINPVWNSTAQRYMFLTGKPDRLNRVGLLALLEQHALLDRCDYSFFINPGMCPSTQDIFCKLSTDDFDQFVKRHQTSPDRIVPKMQPTSLHYGGIPYDSLIFSRSLFRLVSETSMIESRPWITEKTWITVLNKNPFVIAGDLHSCAYLADLGFYTFDTLFDIPSYDHVCDEINRLNSTIGHVNQWLAGNFDKSEVQHMVEHNFRLFRQMAQDIKIEFERVSGYSIEQVIDTVDGAARQYH